MPNINPQSYYRWNDNTLILTVRAVPGAQQNVIGEVFNGAIQIRLTALPMDNKANDALIAFLSKAFKLPKSRITIIAGKKSKIKTVALVEPQQLPEVFGIIAARKA
jgi:uncharacterized protein (TIGR00251 family)